MELIDKSAVKAEIEGLKRNTFTNFDEGVNAAAQILLDFLDTLEVKEVKEEPSDNLEEEIDKELHENWYGEYINLDIFRESAKHFFELGLKAKGE